MDNESLLQDELAEVRQIAEDVGRTVRRALIRWAIRWTIGFGLIAVVVYFAPAWFWLWYLGGAVAGLSLLWTMGNTLVVQRRVKRIEETIKQARLEAEENGFAAGDL